MKFLVTIKLPKNKEHNPTNKITGICPINVMSTCTDITGEHHTILYYAPVDCSIEQVKLLWSDYYHVTRVESLG